MRNPVRPLLRTLPFLPEVRHLCHCCLTAEGKHRSAVLYSLHPRVYFGHSFCSVSEDDAEAHTVAFCI